MKIWLTRHGQTDLNRKRQMQGLTDAPLNKIGCLQARLARKRIGNVRFDAVYASPMQRAVMTASIIGGTEPGEIIIDPRLTEADFGRYEQRRYYCLGPAMTLYWTLPEFFPAPATVESIDSLVARSRSFLQELESKDYENVLITCHGGIIRALRGYLEDRKSGIRWRPKPRNCEIRVYECRDGKHTFLRFY